MRRQILNAPRVSRRDLIRLLGAGGLIAVARPADSDASERLPVALKAYPPPLLGGPWLNTPDEKPIALRDRRGKVTILHYWTFG